MLGLTSDVLHAEGSLLRRMIRCVYYRGRSDVGPASSLFGVCLLLICRYWSTSVYLEWLLWRLGVKSLSHLMFFMKKACLSKIRSVYWDRFGGALGRLSLR